MGFIKAENEDFKTRNAAGNRCYDSILSIIKSRNISKAAKIKMYLTVIKPVVVYGCESWTHSKRMAKELLVWEKKILGRIYGPVKQDGICRSWTNMELSVLFKNLNIAVSVKIKRLKWAGQVLRMNDNSSSISSSSVVYGRFNSNGHSRPSTILKIFSSKILQMCVSI